MPYTPVSADSLGLGIAKVSEAPIGSGTTVNGTVTYTMTIKWTEIGGIQGHAWTTIPNFGYTEYPGSIDATNAAIHTWVTNETAEEVLYRYGKYNGGCASLNE